MNANVSVRASSLATKFCLQLSEAQGLLGPATDVSYHCEIFFYAHKLGSTDLAEGPNVMWHHLLHIPMSIIKDKETINNRSYKYECLDISIYEHVNKTAPAALCAIGRISLYEVNFREPRWVYLVDAAPRGRVRGWVRDSVRLNVGVRCSVRSVAVSDL